MIATQQNQTRTAPTAKELFDYATRGERINYGLYWCLNKMSYFNEQGRTMKEYDQDVTTFSRWVSYKDAEFILSRIDDYHTEHYRCNDKLWWYNQSHNSYEFYHRLPNGGAIHVTIHRPGYNGNRQVVIKHFEKHFKNMKGFE